MNTKAAKDADAPRPEVYSLAIRSKAALYGAWMPLIKGGGLFVPSTSPAKLGEDVLLLVTLLDEPSRIPVQGRVAWVNPADGSHNRPSGFGIQLPDSEACKELKKKVEALLAGALQSSRPTFTL